MPYNVGCSTNYPAGHMAQMLLAAGEDTQPGPAKAQRVAQRLALGDGDIRAVASRRCEEAEGNRVRDNDEQRASPVCQFGMALCLFKVAEEIGLLHDQAGIITGQFIEVRLQFGYGCILTAAIGFDDFTVPGIYRRQYRYIFSAGDAAGHQGCFGGSRSAVVHAGVADFHTGQLADQRLVFIYRLQGSLAGFGLIRGVGGVELAAAGDVADNAGDKVVVIAGAEKAGVLIQTGVLA